MRHKTHIKRIIWLSAIFYTTFFSSCKNENENSPKDFLTSKTWKRALADKNTSSNPPGRILYYAVLNCQKDDIYRFSNNSTLTINQGSDKCDSKESINKTVSYVYNKTDKKLIIDGIEYTLAEESNKQIKYYS